MIEGKAYLEKDRIAVFLGTKGKQKKEFEKKFHSQIKVNSETGDVIIKSENSIDLFILSNIIHAINYGHNPKKAIMLEDETFVLDTIDVKENIKDIERLKTIMGRIIGKNGTTRKIIEEITKCSISVKEHYVSIIGPYENVIIVHEAINMLIRGVSHKSLYGFLEKNTKRLNKGLDI